MMLRKYSKLVLASTALFSATSHASTTANIGTLYGLTPQDVASVQANAMFSHSASSAFYNPAYLADGEHGELKLSYLYADPSLAVRNKTTGITRNDQSNSNRTATIGMKFNMNNLMKQDRNLGFSLVMGLDNRARNLMNINDSISPEGQGQFADYGHKAVFLTTAIGVEIFEGVNFGLGSQLTINTDANVAFSLAGPLSELPEGNTSQEDVNISSQTDFAHIHSLSFDFGKMLCRTDCWADGLEMAYSYREEAGFSINVNSAVGIEALDGVNNFLEALGQEGIHLPNLLIAAMDAYQPEIYTFGSKYSWDNGVSLAFALEKQNWSKLTNRLQNTGAQNTVKDQATIDFRDTTIPRIGLIIDDLGPDDGFWQYANISFTMGYAHEQSKLKDGPTPTVNLFDNDKDVYGMGLDITWSKTHFFKFPVSFSFAVQYHDLKDRDFVLSTLNNSGDVVLGDTVTAGGDVLIGSAALHVRF